MSKVLKKSFNLFRFLGIGLFAASVCSCTSEKDEDGDDNEGKRSSSEAKSQVVRGKFDEARKAVVDMIGEDKIISPENLLSVIENFTSKVRVVEVKPSFVEEGGKTNFKVGNSTVIEDVFETKDKVKECFKVYRGISRVNPGIKLNLGENIKDWARYSEEITSEYKADDGFKAFNTDVKVENGKLIWGGMMVTIDDNFVSLVHYLVIGGLIGKENISIEKWDLTNGKCDVKIFGLDKKGVEFKYIPCILDIFPVLGFDFSIFLSDSHKTLIPLKFLNGTNLAYIGYNSYKNFKDDCVKFGELLGNRKFVDVLSLAGMSLETSGNSFFTFFGGFVGMELIDIHGEEPEENAVKNFFDGIKILLKAMVIPYHFYDLFFTKRIDSEFVKISKIEDLLEEEYIYVGRDNLFSFFEDAAAGKQSVLDFLNGIGEISGLTNGKDIKFEFKEGSSGKIIVVAGREFLHL